MEDVLDIRRPAGKVYTDSAATIAAFLGGPLGAAFVIGHNYQVFGKRREAILSWVIAVVAIALTILSTFVPVLEKIPSIAFAGIFAVISRQIVKTVQAKDMAEHLQHGGGIYPVWRAVLFSLIFTVVIVLGVLIVMNFTDLDAVL